MHIQVIENRYASALITEVRDVNTPSNVLRQRLLELGRLTGEIIVGNELITPKEVTTPMGAKFNGFSIPRGRTVVVSTRDDYEYFAKGISEALPGCLKGYMDFGGLRGPEALTSKKRAIEFPSIKQGQIIDTIVIAKSILATGCTAISLAQHAMAKYHPRKLIVATVFYSQQGIVDIYSEIPNLHAIYTHGEPDKLNQDGMLLPGVGNLDRRLSEGNKKLRF